MRHTVGYHHAASKCLMPHQERQTGNGTALHLKIGDVLALILKCLNLVILLRVGQWQTHLAPLWSEKSATSNGDAAHHVVGRNTVEQILIGMHGIRMGYTLGAMPIHVFKKCSFEREV